MATQGFFLIFFVLGFYNAQAIRKPRMARITPKCNRKLLCPSQPADGKNCITKFAITRIIPINGSKPFRWAK